MAGQLTLPTPDLEGRGSSLARRVVSLLSFVSLHPGRCCLKTDGISAYPGFNSNPPFFFSNNFLNFLEHPTTKVQTKRIKRVCFLSFHIRI